VLCFDSASVTIVKARYRIVLDVGYKICIHAAFLCESGVWIVGESGFNCEKQRAVEEFKYIDSYVHLHRFCRRGEYNFRKQAHTQIAVSITHSKSSRFQSSSL
jgi:hypothetical protein